MYAVEKLNIRCAEFIREKVPAQLLPHWLKLQGSYQHMSFSKVLELSQITRIVVSQLVLKYGFGRQSITIDQMQEYLDSLHENLEIVVCERYEVA